MAIEVFANDRRGLLADIIQQLDKAKATILEISSKVNQERIAITDIVIEIENVEDLNKTMKILRDVDSVYDVKRRK